MADINHILFWAKETLSSLQYDIQGEPKIVREVPWSCVYSFNTSKGRVFLKYMDPEFSLEPKLLKYLHDNVTQNVTEVIASDGQLSCFLMKDAGEPLRPILKAEFNQELFAHALTLCADIQLTCIPHVDRLIALGINDWRLDKIPILYKEFIDKKELLKADGLTESEIEQLHHLTSTMDYLCDKLKAYGIPETIEHCDFHDNNILIQDAVMTINDWGDASISHPFFSCVSALESAKRNHNLQDDAYMKILCTYLDKWSSYGSKQDLLTAFTLARQIRFFMFALSFSRIKSCPEIDKFPEFNGYMAEALRSFITSGYIIPIEPSHPELPAVIAYSIGNPTDERVQKILDGYRGQNNPLIGYFVGGNLAGVIGLEISQDSATIQHISVLPNYQSNGIGKQLVHHVMKQFSPKTLSAETDADAVGFYRAMGFECSASQGKFGTRYICVRINC
ncbi:MAG: GNAT family N-acetyltransferase [Alphaproteobacteria bacterium]|nr:GNAT family N-acetyltransferase [Alphaproteobacteria bacterium]